MVIFLALSPSAKFMHKRARAARELSNVFLLSELGSPEPGYLFITTPQIVQTKPDMLRAFLKATYVGYKLANSDTNVAITSLARSVPGVAIDVATENWMNWRAFQCSSDQKGRPLGEVPSARWQESFDFFAEAGLITKQPNRASALGWWRWQDSNRHLPFCGRAYDDLAADDTANCRALALIVKFIDGANDSTVLHWINSICFLHCPHRAEATLECKLESLELSGRLRLDLGIHHPITLNYFLARRSFRISIALSRSCSRLDRRPAAALS